MQAFCRLAFFFSLCSSQFTLLDDFALDGVSEPGDNFGAEDKLLPCNDELIFVDLDRSWNKVCDSCTAEETDCPFVGRVYVNSSEPDPVGYCKAQCESQSALNCNAINIGEDGKGNMDCVFRSCNDIPPATDPIDPSKCPGCTYAVYSFWNGVVITYDIAKQVWGRVPINQTACPDPNQPPAPLTPRDSGYTLGAVRRSGGDRLLLLGGDSNENNVYYSDDCGRTFMLVPFAPFLPRPPPTPVFHALAYPPHRCYDGNPNDDPNLSWDSRSFAPIVHPVGLFPNDPVFMMGGAVLEQLPSIGVFYAQTGIDDWTRPPCDGAADSDCCQQPNGVWYLCLPDPFVWPGMVAYDSAKLFVFYNSTVVSQSAATWGGPWAREPGSAFGSFGRRVWIRGSDAYPGAGCWFSTDFSPADLWLQSEGFSSTLVTSSNGFATSFAPGGPWLQLNAPWSPRASAAVVASADGQTIFFGGGMDFLDGVPTGVFFGDVWSVDSRVCLLTAESTFCNDHGAPNADAVACVCDPAWAGDPLCGSCGATFAGATCQLCQAGYYGPSCAACSPCVNGACSGGGTQGGTGQCVCNAGWTGPSCSTAVSLTPSQKPAPSGGGGGGGNSAAGGSGLTPGAAAGVSFVVIGAAVAAGLWVFVAKFGGGPAVSAALDSAKSAGASLVARVATPRGAGAGGAPASTRFAAPGGAAGERTGLLASPRAPLSPEAAAKRFGAI